jgi:cysteine desulfurase
LLREQVLRRIYLDHNATTRPHAAVRELVARLQADVFGNASSLHWFGQQARRALDRAREQTAALIHAQPDEIVFTSGGTEANNHALLGLAALRGAPGHAITSRIEHQAVLNPCRHLEERGWRVTYLNADEQGRVDPAAVETAITPDTAFVSLMLANNDTGVLQPVREVAAPAHARGVAVHTDAVQAVGKIAVDVRELGVDALSLSGHKLYGPKGVGALYLRHGVAIPPLLRGGHHEQHRRAGTENVPAIAGFGLACELAAAELAGRMARAAAWRDRLEQGIRERFPWARINGHPTLRLPNTLHVSFPGLDNEVLLLSLDLLGVAASGGSACTAGNQEPSHVLLAMGRSLEEARGALRFSFGEDNTDADVDAALAALAQVIGTMRPAREGARP